MEYSKAQRLKIMYERFAAAPAASTADEALQQITDIMTAVEDEYTNIPNNPDAFLDDGRLYPPNERNKRLLPNYPHITRFRSAKHNTYIGANGSIEIRSVQPEQIEFKKPGLDGRDVWDLD